MSCPEYMIRHARCQNAIGNLRQRWASKQSWEMCDKRARKKRGVSGKIVWAGGLLYIPLN
jgi:hypothetical protein